MSAGAKSHGIAYIDHAIIASIAPPQVDISVLGWDADRIAKTASLSDDTLAQRYLDVCTDQSYQASCGDDQPVNCGRCAKCVRTMLTLDGVGSIEAFSIQFPMDHYRQDRGEMIGWIKTLPHPLDHAVAELFV